MAKITTVLDFAVNGKHHICNVSFGVGPKCSNFRDDVLLVQTLLNKILVSTNPLVGPDGKYVSQSLKLDGICGPKTSAAIWAYQNHLKTTRGVAVKVDGRVDSSNELGISPGTLNRFTIYLLNRDHRSIYRKELKDTDLPPALAEALRRNSPEFFS